MSQSLRLKHQLRFESFIPHETEPEYKIRNGLNLVEFLGDSGLPDVTATARQMFMATFMFLFDTKSFLNTIDLAPRYVGVVVSGEMAVRETFYNVNDLTGSATVKLFLRSFASTSASCAQGCSLYFGEETEPVILLNIKVALLDMTTGKSTAFPDWWTQKYKLFRQRRSNKQMPTFQRPGTMFCHGVRTEPYTLCVTRRDMDMFNHTNTFSYLKFCEDALQLHTVKNFPESPGQCLRLQNATFLVKGRSVVGDILNVAFWDNDDGSICFDIRKSGKLIFQSKMTFYDPLELIKPSSRL